MKKYILKERRPVDKKYYKNECQKLLLLTDHDEFIKDMKRLKPVKNLNALNPNLDKIRLKYNISNPFLLSHFIAIYLKDNKVSDLSKIANVGFYIKELLPHEMLFSVSPYITKKEIKNLIAMILKVKRDHYKTKERSTENFEFQRNFDAYRLHKETGLSYPELFKYIKHNKIKLNYSNPSALERSISLIRNASDELKSEVKNNFNRLTADLFEIN